MKKIKFWATTMSLNRSYVSECWGYLLPPGAITDQPFNFVVHHTVRTNLNGTSTQRPRGWEVSELTTGMALTAGSFKTQDKAVAIARDRLNFYEQRGSTLASLVQAGLRRLSKEQLKVPPWEPIK